MKKKGFTLVELLAVITLLGLLGLIIVPIITNTIEKQRKGAFEASVNGILDLVQNKSQNNDFEELVYSFDTDKLYLCDDINENCDSTNYITTSGKISKGEGYIKIDANGYTTLSIKNDQFCAFKTVYSDIEVTEDLSFCKFGEAVGKAVEISLRDEYTKYDYFEIMNNGLYGYSYDTYNYVLISEDDLFLHLDEGFIEYHDGYLYDLSISSTKYCATDYRSSIIKFRNSSCSLRAPYYGGY